MELIRRRGSAVAGAVALLLVGGLMATFLSTRASANDDRSDRFEALARANALARLADEVGDLRARVKELENELSRAKTAAQLRAQNLRADLQAQRSSLVKRIMAARSSGAAKSFADHWDDKRAAFLEGDFFDKDWDHDWDHKDWDHGDWDDDDWDDDDWDGEDD